MTSNLKYVKLLPMLNLDEHFVVTQEAHTSLGEDWLDFTKHTIDLAFKEDTKFKTVRDAVKKKTSLFTMSDKAKNLLGMGEAFSVIDIDIDEDNNFKVTQLLSYDDLINMYFSEENQKVHGSPIRAIVDRFFGYQWGKEKLLYPIKRIPKGLQRPDNWNEMVQESELAKMLTSWFKQKSKSKLSKTVMHRRQALNRVLSATRWYSPDQITENELTMLRAAIKEGSELSGERRTEEFDILIINDLRYMLIDSGRKDIRLPRDLAREKKSDYYGEGSSIDERFEWLDVDNHPNLIELKENGYGYLRRLKDSGLAVGTINTKSTAVNNFFRFLLDKLPFAEITVDVIDDIFEPRSKNNLFDYLEETRSTQESAIIELHGIIPFLVHSELYSAKARKNTPIKRRKIRLQPYRDAMPKEMVAHIVDILKHRPPESTTRWDKHKADSSWWEHDVYPVFPMMMLFGYFIPLRGEQIRNLCRDASFVFNSNNQLETFVINTDKNVNRKYLQEIPCVWDDLQAFIPFLKWHKEYYPYLSKVKYHNDDNSPWEDIEPLMVTPQVLRPMSRYTHFDYHKRVLCKYQIEKIQEAEKRGDSNYPAPVVAWNKTDKPFFKNLEELDSASTEKMKEIGLSYDIHSLRVTGATRYLESGVGLATVMELTGHMSSDTLMRVYINLTRKEKVEKLESAIDKIFFGDKENLIENSADLIHGELTRAYKGGKENLETSFEDNALFSMSRKASYTEEALKLEKGTEIAQKKHPTCWLPMIHGICPGVKCPEGRENKCSLCPFLITGKLFIDGVIHQINLTFARFQRESLELQEERTKGYTNQSRMEGLETILEEILGWQEILDRIEVSLSKQDGISQKDNTDIIPKKMKKVFGSEVIATDLVYLKNAYDAQLIGVEQDRYALKVLTITAMKLAVQSGDKNQFDLVSGDETKSIDMLMQYYSKGVEHKEDVEKFVSSIKMIPKMDKK